jgi:uncharacterized protein (UPF0332 family)
MIFSWKDYYTLAGQLKQQAVDSPQQEAFLRSAISRAYYASFCLARNYLCDSLGRKSAGIQDDHEFVKSQFRSLPGLDYQTVAENLRRLRGYRNQADYDDELPGITNTAVMAMNMAGKVIETLERFTNQ